MASDFSIRAVNNWRREVHTDMAMALHVSQDVFHRTATQANKHAIILMAQSARALTRQSPKNRKVKTDSRGKYIEDLRKGGREWHEWQWKTDSPPRATWEQMRAIGSRGLAKRSWMWGLSKLKGDVAGFNGGGSRKEIPGVVNVQTIGNAKDRIGYVVTNRLSYIEKALPAGWEATVAQKATNLIMKRAEMKMVKDFERSVGARRAA